MESTLFEMADQLKSLREKKKSLEDEAKSVGAEADALEKRLSDEMTEQELDRFSRNGSTFYLSSRLFASPRDGDKTGMIDALRSHGFGDLVTETVPAGTLASFAREQLALSDSGQLPGWLSDVVSTFDKVTVGIRKG